MTDTISQCLAKGHLLVESSESPRRDVEVLLSWVLECDRAYFYTWPEKLLTDEQQKVFDGAFARREQGEPVAHIMGEREFWSLPFYTDASTLIPRPDTELLVELALHNLGEKPGRVLDLGTGTGAIILALASERPDCSFCAADFSANAVALAIKNAQRLSLSSVNIFQSNWFENVEGQFDLIVSNPPYIDKNDVHLSQGDVRFEPRSALVAEDEGLSDIKHIVCESKSYLLPNAWLMLEHGWQQKEAVQKIFKEHGYVEVETVKDCGGNDRVTMGRFIL